MCSSIQAAAPAVELAAGQQAQVVNTHADADGKWGGCNSVRLAVQGCHSCTVVQKHQAGHAQQEGPAQAAAAAAQDRLHSSRSPGIGPHCHVDPSARSPSRDCSHTGRNSGMRDPPKWGRCRRPPQIQHSAGSGIKEELSIILEGMVWAAVLANHGPRPHFSPHWVFSQPRHHVCHSASHSSSPVTFRKF